MINNKEDSTGRTLHDRSYNKYKRKCTDIIFLMVFILFTIWYGYTVKYSYENGHPGQLLSPVNHDGILCGEGDHLGYPKLYYLLTHDDPTPKEVCVTECPTNADSTFDCIGNSAVDKTVCEYIYYDAEAKSKHVGKL